MALDQKLTEAEILEIAKTDPSKLLPKCKEILCCLNGETCLKEGHGICYKGIGIILAKTYLETAGLCDAAIKAAFIGAYGEKEGNKLYEQWG